MAMFRVDPRVRAYGKARIDITRRAKDEQEWQRQWKEPRYPFPFTWGQGWKHSFQYQVDDFAAEVGFWMDVMGLPAYAFSPSNATFTSPDQAFAFSVSAAPENSSGTPPDTVRVQFMVADLKGAVEELERRGVVFEQKPGLSASQASSIDSGCFRTPHGICVDLLGAIQPAAAAVLGSTEVEVEETLASHWQKTEVSPVVAAEQPGPTDAVEDSTPDDDADPFAGLTFAPVQEPPQDSLQPNTFDGPSPEGKGTDHEPVKPNGSKGWSHIQSFSGNSSRVADHRRGDVFPRSALARGSGAGRRAGSNRRKNPFSTQDLPPPPDLPSHRVAPRQKEPSPPHPEPRPPEDMPPLFRQNQFEVEGPNGQTNQPPEGPGPVEDEPRYEDLEEGTDKGLEDIFP